SKTPGHPEFRDTPGGEATTGPLGQGIANAVGMALSLKMLAARVGEGLIDGYVYGICSDGDLMEGVSAEASSLAGHLQLGNLVFLYDDNRVSLAGHTEVTFTEDRLKRYEAFGWFTQQVDDGNDTEAIDRAIRAAKQQKERPSLIAVRTVIGYGSPNKADTHEAHGSPLGKHDCRRGDAEGLAGGDPESRRAGAQPGGRIRRPRSLHLHVHQGRRRREAGRLPGPQHPLRRPRARDGRRLQRLRLRRVLHSVRRD